MLGTEALTVFAQQQAMSLPLPFSFFDSHPPSTHSTLVFVVLSYVLVWAMT